MGKKRDVAEAPAEKEVPKKLYDVAKFLKSHLPEKSTSLLGHKVNYFIGRKAIDALMESKLKEKLEINSRNQAVYLMEDLLAYKLFHRARKITMEVKSKKKQEQEGAEEDTESNVTPKATPRAEKGKKKFKLDMHHEQIFVDANEPYVWLYDPIPLKTWVLGSLFVVAAIAICMFPLWPRKMRDGVYYLSVAAAGFLGVILSLAVVRQILFIIIFMASLGKHRLWILPNLTEDCGFFESFVPLYSYEFCGDGVKASKGDSKSAGAAAGSVAGSSGSGGASKKKSKESTSRPKASASASTSSSKEEKTGSEESEFEILDAGEVKKDQ